MVLPKGTHPWVKLNPNTVNTWTDLQLYKVRSSVHHPPLRRWVTKVVDWDGWLNFRGWLCTCNNRQEQYRLPRKSRLYACYSYLSIKVIMLPFTRSPYTVNHSWLCRDWASLCITNLMISTLILDLQQSGNPNNVVLCGGEKFNSVGGCEGSPPT